LKKQFENKIFDDDKEIVNLFKSSNNSLLSDSENHKDNNYKINFEINKHHIKEEHLVDLNAYLTNNLKFEDFNRNFEIHKSIDSMPTLHLNNNTYNSSYYDKKSFNISIESKADKSLLDYLPSEAPRNNNKTEKKGNEFNVTISQLNNGVDKKKENETNVKYDFVYYPHIRGSKIQLSLRKNGVFTCKDCHNNDEEDDDKNAIDMKVPDEDKWVKLKPVEFVKKISKSKFYLIFYIITVFLY